MSEKSAGTILLVGAGRMGGALLKGWLARGIEPDRIAVIEPSPAPEMAEFLKQSGISFSQAAQMHSPPSVIVLAVKPQVIDEIAASIAPQAGAATVILSIAAGRTIESLARHFTPGAPIVRVMPNTPAAIGRGISALYANAAVTPEQAKFCSELLSAGGETVWLDDEALMDAVTAVSGSGPAYVFLLAESLAEAGQSAGLAPELAAKLARETVCGAGELLYQSDLDMAELRKNVTSPGGTTAAALQVLMGEDMSATDGPMPKLLRDAVAAAVRRSKELGS